MSTPRASQQAWAVPATQNTAPVIKFRCLYTHDLRRKAKRWQDGYLRFHTFNKRVMVYDTPGNFIGDLHWRQDAPLEDGDELELDRGVLIQVCEPMETTKTDISAIYSHKKSQTSPSQTRDQPTPSLRPSTPVRSSISSQPSRSLNDLLGIKKTAPVGKLVSHYEEHNGTRSNQKDQHTVERAPKRQRVESSERPRQPDSPRSDHQPELIDLSNSTTTGGLSNGVTPVFEGNGNLARARAKSPRPRNVPPKTANTVEKNMDAVKTPSNPPAEPSRSTEPPISAAKPPQTSHSNPPTNSLRLSTSKPRKKLMYRELLPGQASARKPPPQVVDLTDCDPAPSTADYMPSASTMVAFEEVTTRPESLQSAPTLPQTLTARSSTTVLRKAHSDPSPLANTRQVPTRPESSDSSPNDVGNEQEQGPWTSEALDLFSFWPPGRPKPERT